MSRQGEAGDGSGPRCNLNGTGWLKQLPVYFVRRLQGWWKGVEAGLEALS